jgi:hypothetical protein
MFIKLSIVDNKVIHGSVDMVDFKKGNNESYPINTKDKYKKKVTNFYFGEEEQIYFDTKTKKIICKVPKKSFSLNEFIEIIVKNHLSDRLFWKRGKNYLAINCLKFFFWLSDRHYKGSEVMTLIYGLGSETKDIKDNKVKAEPFFKYFYITKNILFILFI